MATTASGIGQQPAGAGADAAIVRYASSGASYAQFVRSTGDIRLHISGQVSVDDAGVCIGEGDFRLQVKTIFSRLEAILNRHGAGRESVVKMTVFLMSFEDYDVFASERLQYFGRHLPASSAVQVAGLIQPQFLLEVDAEAVLSAGATPAASEVEYI